MFAAVSVDKLVDTSGTTEQVNTLATEPVEDGIWILCVNYGIRCELGTHKFANKKCKDDPRAYKRRFYLASRWCRPPRFSFHLAMPWNIRTSVLLQAHSFGVCISFFLATPFWIVFHQFWSTCKNVSPQFNLIHFKSNPYTRYTMSKRNTSLPACIPFTFTTSGCCMIF